MRTRSDSIRSSAYGMRNKCNVTLRSSIDGIHNAPDGLVIVFKTDQTGVRACANVHGYSFHHVRVWPRMSTESEMFNAKLFIVWEENLLKSLSTMENTGQHLLAVGQLSFICQLSRMRKDPRSSSGKIAVCAWLKLIQPIRNRVKLIRVLSYCWLSVHRHLIAHYEG